MLVKESALKDSTLNNLEKSLKANYSFKNGENLDSVLKEVLNNRTLNLYLLSFLPADKGIRIGKTGYWDDIRVHVYYGLTLDFNEIPRKTGLFISEQTSADDVKLKAITNHFPTYYEQYKSPFDGWPSPQEFLERVNNILSDEDKIKDYLVDLKR